ncbi:MAG: PAS domain-containing sensor histidine kinase, partial [Thermoguttaceae bacterium]
LGYTRDELLSLVVADIEMNVAESASHWNYASSKYPVSFEGVHRRKDGTQFPVEIRLAQLETNGQQLMLALAHDISDRKQAEQAIRQEQRLLRRLLDLHEQDRKLVAYEIHDGLAQQLAAAVYRFQSVPALEQHNPKAAKEVFNESLQLLRDAMAEARRLISGLRPPVLDESGVVAAVECLIAERRPQEGPEIEFVHDDIGRLATPLEGAIFRIVQEAVTNAQRHSHSPRVRIDITQREGRIHVGVRDWGVGFNPDSVPTGHFGVQGIQERARLLGGSAAIESSPGQGVSVTVDLPAISQSDLDA